MDPEFEKLVDPKFQAMVERYVKPEPWYSKLLWGVLGSLVASALIAIATFVYSEGSACHVATPQANARIAETDKKI
ncbi:hypothetical protein O9X90_25675 [Agrobacterium leguminum]|uniref:hypothetical protein n=1 Tax=Agrobacterium leguminum TaxID=2792015 RepID=UPI0022B839A1|nr:hypothetical protein [Agrobacterium leguminum]MCZ7935721.1 hypothetical protein [Agrobacterium leguminum]